MAMADDEKREAEAEVERDVAYDAAARACEREQIALAAAQIKADEARQAQLQASHEKAMRHVVQDRAEQLEESAATSRAGAIALGGAAAVALLLVAWWAWSMSGPDVPERQTSTVNVMPAQPAPSTPAPAQPVVVTPPPAQSPPVVLERSAPPRDNVVVVTPPANPPAGSGSTAAPGSTSGTTGSTTGQAVPSRPGTDTSAGNR